MKILVVQLRRIGDILLTTPTVAYLKQVFPGCTLHFLAEPMGASVLETNPHIDRLIIYDRSNAWGMIKLIRAEHYDVVLDFMNNPRTAVLTFLSGARWKVGWRHTVRGIFYNVAVPIPVEPEYVPVRKLRMTKYWLAISGIPHSEPALIRPELFLTKEDEAVADAWMKELKIHPKEYVIMAPTSRYPVRCWRKEGFREVALELSAKHNKKVFLAWGPGEEAWMAEVRKGEENTIGLLPATSMREMAAIFKQAALVVSNDSGAMHTAVAVKTPTVTIYGPTRPIDWNPSLAGAGMKDIPLNASELDCLGCHLLKCPIGHLCMKNLGAEKVLAACEKVLLS